MLHLVPVKCAPLVDCCLHRPEPVLHVAASLCARQHSPGSGASPDVRDKSMTSPCALPEDVAAHSRTSGRPQ